MRNGRSPGCSCLYTYDMARKTTVYLPDDLKLAVEQEAKRRGCSEAQVIRNAIESAVTQPRPRAGIIAGKAIAGRADELLTGFGDR